MTKRPTKRFAPGNSQVEDRIPTRLWKKRIGAKAIVRGDRRVYSRAAHIQADVPAQPGKVRPALAGDIESLGGGPHAAAYPGVRRRADGAERLLGSQAGSLCADQCA